MDDLSDNSNINIDDVTRMVGNLDDLDNNLFGDALRKDNSNTTIKSQKNMRDTQKKVVFQDFDDDDNLLNDILSDSNDSNQNSKPINNINDNKIADLFGIKSTQAMGINNNSTKKLSDLKKNDTHKSVIDNVWPITNKSNSITLHTPIENTTQSTDKISDNKPFKSELKADIAKKSSLMEDLFGTRSRATSLKEIYSGPVNKNFIESEESVSASMPNLVKNHQPLKKSTSSMGFTLSSSVNKEPRRGRPKSGLIDDPLGLLTASSNTIEETPPITKEMSECVEKKITSAPSSDDLPEWLGGKKKLNQETDKSINNCNTKIDTDKSNNDKAVEVDKNIQKNSFFYTPISLLSETQFEQQSAIVTMQQQENELRTATILSHQSDQLNCIVESQKHKMEEQEKLFDNLIKRQIDRQSILESQIKLQQARIDQYIQALVKQPQVTLPSGLRSININTPDNKDNEHIQVELESLLHTLEIEKNSLEHMIDILKDKHEKEIKILENSHETQIRFMQETMDKLEAKLRQDIEDLEKDYQKKIDRLSNEKSERELYFKEQIDIIKTNHEKIIDDIHTRHSQYITWLQNEHTETMKNITHAKEQERNTVDFITSHKTDLDKLIEQSQHIYSDFKIMSEQIKIKDTEIIDKREYYLKNQDETLRALIEQLKMQQETLDIERKQLSIVAHELKSETSQLSMYSKKNTEMYTERETRYGMLEKSLIRERELLHEQCKWEREHLQSLKEAWITEQKQQIKLLMHEREAVAVEKAKLEVLSSFKSNSDDILKAELEAALKTAHNATHEANIERQKWQERSDCLDADRHDIEKKEKQLIQRAKELDDLTKSALLKRDEGIIALKEAQRVEKQYKERIDELQMQLKELTEREQKIAMEKISLARDRLALRVCQVEEPEKDMTNNSQYNYMNESIYVHSSNTNAHIKDIVDPQLLLLKLNLDNKLDTSYQLLTDIEKIG